MAVEDKRKKKENRETETGLRGSIKIATDLKKGRQPGNAAILGSISRARWKNSENSD
jgi:hypothetical protein